MSDFDEYFCNEVYAAEILQQKYQSMSTEEVAMLQTHLTESQKKQLQEVFERHKVLFDGRLGKYPHAKYDLKLKEGATPVFKRPYPVPFSTQKLFKVTSEYIDT